MSMCLVGMMTTPGSTELAHMFATRGFYITHVSLLKVEDFTVDDSVFWGFQIRGFHIVGQKCSAESKDWRVSRETLCGTVPHGEVHIVVGSFSSSRSHNPLHFLHSERGKLVLFPFVLVEGFGGLFSVKLGILEEIQEHRAVFGVA